MGGPNSDGYYGTAVDAAGNVVAVGSFRDTISIVGTSGPSAFRTSAGGADFVVVKYDPAGAILWATTGGGTSDDVAQGVAIDIVGNIHVIGRSASAVATFGGVTPASLGGEDVVAWKLSPVGATLWAKRFGSACGDQGLSIAVDGAGNLALGGAYGGAISFGGGPLTPSFPGCGSQDAFAVKLAPDGSHLWSRGFPGSGTSASYGIASDLDGTVALVGAFTNGVNFGGGTRFAAAPQPDAFVVRLSAGGTYLWDRQLGGPTGGDYATGVALSATGDAAVVGYASSGTADWGTGPLPSFGGQDLFVARYGPTGAPLWVKRIGGTYDEQATGVAIDAADRMLVGGFFKDSVNFGGVTLTTFFGASDPFLAIYTAGGGLLSAVRMGDQFQNDQGRAVASGGPGNRPALAGYFNGSGGFLGTTLTSAGGADGFVARPVP